MKRAIIDIGTNSVRLLVAERPDGGEWKTVTKKVNSTCLGEGMANNKALSLAAKERTLAAVKTFADEARSAGISDLTAYGTAIFRDSPEGPEFAKAISETIKAPMHILTGKEEAFYSYIGAAGTSGALTAVVDIGGGSTEICMGFGTDIGFRISFPLGCVRCTGQFDVVGARGITVLNFSLRPMRWPVLNAGFLWVVRPRPLPLCFRSWMYMMLPGFRDLSLSRKKYPIC